MKYLEPWPTGRFGLVLDRNRRMYSTTVKFANPTAYPKIHFKVLLNDDGKCTRIGTIKAELQGITPEQAPELAQFACAVKQEIEKRIVGKYFSQIPDKLYLSFDEVEMEV